MLNELNLSDAMQAFCTGSEVYATQGYFDLTESATVEERNAFRITPQNYLHIFNSKDAMKFWTYVDSWKITIAKPTKVQCIDNTVIFHYHSAREASAIAQPFKLLLGDST